MKKNLLFLLSLMLCSVLALAQKNVTGKVTGNDGEPLPGVNIRVKNSQIGVSSDVKGTFTIDATSNDILVLSSVGFMNQEVVVGNRSSINITLNADTKSLEEVVVIGYGSVQKKDLIGSIGVAKSKDFGTVVATDAAQLIQGKLAGVQVINNGGLPGAGTKIYIRGTGSFTSSDPLYLIDGLPGDINSVSPQDIEEMSVMKDASAIAIYGSRAANGIVMVTTKKGKSGGMRVSYSGWVGVSSAWKRLDLLNASQYIDLVKEIVPNYSATSIIGKPEALIDRTNWQDQIFRTGKSTEHHINLSGGSEKLLYSVSMGYSNQQGIIQNYDYQRYNFRVNLIENISKKIRIGQALNMRYTVSSGSQPSFLDAIRMPPYAPVLDPNNLGGFSNITPNIDLQDAQNPQTRINLIDKVDRGLGTTLQIFGEVELFQGLRFRTQGTADAGLYSGYEYSKEFRNGNLYYPRGLNEYVSTGIYNPLIENFLTYSKEFGKHNINAVVGGTYANGMRISNINITGANFPNDELPNLKGAGTLNVSGGDRLQDYNKRWSYFGRFQYGYDEKYLITASVRQDYSPAFGLNKRSGIFPAVGLAWRVSQEDFMKDLPSVSDLKIRGSFGVTGNDNIGLFQNTRNGPVFRGYLPGAPTYSFGDTKDYLTGATVATIGNPDLQWEETKTLNLGFDLGLFKNRLTLGFDYYQRNSDKLLVRIPVSPSTGLGEVYNSPSIPLNAGSATNKGFETTLMYRKSEGDFKYSLSGNVSYNKNEVTLLGTTNPIVGGGFDDVSATQKTDVGLPIGAYWGYKMDKVAVNKAEVDALNARAKEKAKVEEYQANLKPGDIIFKDLNGDGVVDDKDQTFLGSPIPTWMFGVNFNASFKGFDMSLAASGLGDVQVANALTYHLEGTNKVFNGSTALLNRWRKEGDISTIPKAGQNATGARNLRPSDRYIEDASYLRFREISFGYSINKNALKNVFGDNVSSVRVYVTGQNLITITSYKGYDPELAGGNGIFDRGVDRGQFPQPRIFMLGVQVGF